MIELLAFGPFIAIATLLVFVGVLVLVAEWWHRKDK